MDVRRRLICSKCSADLVGNKSCTKQSPVCPLQGKENNPGQALGVADSGPAQGLGEDSPPPGQQNPRLTPHPAYDPRVTSSR